MENQDANQDLDLEEIIRAEREAASTLSKDWILKQIRGGGTSERAMREEHINDGPRDTATNEVGPPGESKKQQRNASRGGKKGDRREASESVVAGAPGPSKRAKANNGEQISVIVQECLK
ncbi:hypothetical protein NDU88_002834 [Pleurodeles waltl]|uniref:Uncharacterized protein n=1 Tax=Pleurodeles waltl TaxID=8319 RepID=A0AAV7M2N6_PLEWA|nr:hypothetical protein NDU88_002834 [Pleurodeles waltl]